MSNNDIWILAEQQDDALQSISFELLNRATALVRDGSVNAIVLGHHFDDAELNRLIACGADRVVAVEDQLLQSFLLDPYVAALNGVLDEFEPAILLAGATTLGRTLLPYVAMRRHTGLTADCTRLELEPDSGLLLQTRPAIGGNIMATIQCPVHRPQMATIRPHSTRPAEPQPGRTGVIERHRLPAAAQACRMRQLSYTPNREELTLQDADKVIVVGRGIKKAENLALIFQLAEILGAAVGATRDVVDRGWLSYPHQVGLSGKTIMPKLYLGVGVSGAIQHLAGMQTAETIVAVNSDPEAQIFKVADFGIVGNLFEALPLLAEELKAGKKS